MRAIWRRFRRCFVKIFAWGAVGGGIMLALNVPLKRLMAGSK
jgi:hypothetical protein